MEEAVKRYQDKNRDTKIAYLSLPQQDEADGLGTFWHPSAITHEKTAKLVTEFAKDFMEW